MARHSIACADISELSWQAVLRAHPDWRDVPAVMLESDKPTARVIFPNTPAREHGIVHGLRLHQAQALCHTLHACAISVEETREAQQEILHTLLQFSPHVEPAKEWPGVFFLDASGLSHLYPSLQDWAQKLQSAIFEIGFAASVVVGFHRYRVFAIARQRNHLVVLKTPAQESQQARRTLLAKLYFPPNLLEAMSVLEVHTLGDFLQLPRSALHTRYGEQAARIHTMASGERTTPILPYVFSEDWCLEIPIEAPDNDMARLLFAFKPPLESLAKQLGDCSQAITALHMELELEHRAPHVERIETASPTLDVMQMLELVRLRLSSVSLPAAVVCVHIQVESMPVYPQQHGLTFTAPKRDLAAANRALARIKAAFGAHAVSRAALERRYLPKSSFRWEPVAKVQFPKIEPRLEPPTLVRQFLPKPREIPPFPTQKLHAWELGVVQRMHGPYRTSGGWWHRRIERDEYFVETQDGSILWVYFDKRLRRWFQYGWVD